MTPCPARALRRILALVAVAAVAGGCAPRRAGLLREVPAERRANPRVLRMEVTAYCPCGQCCGWERGRWGRPVFAYGPQKGQPKRVGITASGTRARPGTIAADTTLLPFGTIVYVPGYGYGRVEDRGGAIRGRRLDVFFRRHGDALEWGRQTLDVKVWTP